MSLKRKYGSCNIPPLIRSVNTEPGTWAFTTQTQALTNICITNFKHMKQLKELKKSFVIYSR